VLHSRGDPQRDRPGPAAHVEHAEPIGEVGKQKVGVDAALLDSMRRSNELTQTY
jgi:hypothetical protein